MVHSSKLDCDTWQGILGSIHKSSYTEVVAEQRASKNSRNAPYLPSGRNQGLHFRTWSYKATLQLAYLDLMCMI